MGELKATVREHKAEIDELKTENKRLKKEVEWLEGERKTSRSIHGNRARRGNPGDVNGRNSNDNTDTSHARGIKVEATFYSAFCDTGCIGITKTGLDVRNTIYTPEGLRVIAVDPTVIKLGSKVRVTLANGDSFEAKAEDTGGDIKGARIDVLVSDEATAYKLGRQAAKVEVISE